MPRPAITKPARPGPTIEATWAMILFRLSAFVRCSLRTRFGASAWRAGPSNAVVAAVHAASK